MAGAIGAFFVPRRLAGWVHVSFSALTLLIGTIFILDSPVSFTQSVDWFTVGDNTFKIGFYYDSLTAVMAVVVGIVALMVSVFSVEYMKHDTGQNRYFAYLGLFAFAMYGIVISSNLLMTFVFWELVGFASYLLIGFWYKQEAPPKSSFKAFLMNKIGDVGFLLGIFLAWNIFGTLEIRTLLDQVSTLGLDSFGASSFMISAMGIGLFLAAVGKSAQFPLQTWLPDAMTGPTPVSALMHAATMVAAGVYLMVRVFPLLSFEVLQNMIIAGGLTAFMGAFAAFAQTDIKKVLAYSTVSQLGFMIAAVGSGFPLAAFFHLVTHAFFKAGLFLCAGSVIHYFHESHLEGNDGSFDPQDIRNMGGLRKVLPVTFWVFTVCMLSLEGIPLFSGFLSKELILTGLLSGSQVPIWVTSLVFLSVLMTAAYMGRVYFIVFFGEYRRPRFNESLKIKLPLITLAVLSLGFVFVLNPVNLTSGWLHDRIIPITKLNGLIHSPLITVLSIVLATLGILISYLYVQKNGLNALMVKLKYVFYSTSMHHFYLDYFYRNIFSKFMIAKAKAIYYFDKYVFDGIVNLLPRLQLSLAKLIDWIDKNIIDGIVNGIAKADVVVSFVAGWVDKYILDGLINGVASLSKFLGDKARNIQGGNVQLYFVWALFGMMAIYYFLR